MDRFLPPVLQIQMVLNAPTVGEVEEALDTLPSTLYEAFDETLLHIRALPAGRKQVALKTLMWISYARSKRSLRMNDLREALAVRPGQKSTDPRMRPSTAMILSCCQGLVTMGKETHEPRFIHQAVNDYLHSHEDELFPEREEYLANTCLIYLLTTPLKAPCDKEDELRERATSTPFLWYAASHWGHHAQQSQNEHVRSNIMELLGLETARSCCIQISQYLCGLRQMHWSAEEARSYTKLHVAAYFGLEEATNNLLKPHDVDVDARTAKVRTTALMMASSYGHVSIMSMLIQRGAQTRKQNWFGNCLHIAAEANQCEVIKYLLDLGMDADCCDKYGLTPLDCALRVKNMQAVRALVDDAHLENICEELLRFQPYKVFIEEPIGRLVMEEPIGNFMFSISEIFKVVQENRFEVSRVLSAYCAKLAIEN